MIISKVADCLQRLGYKRLTEIQRRSLVEVFRENRSAIIVAPTGSGKTEAAIFPIMLKIKTRNIEPIAAIYITPLRALNRDIERRLIEVSKCFELNIGVRHGDTPASIRKNIVENPPHILITTPESFNYVIMNEEIRSHLRNLEYIVIDEYRDLVESKRGLLFLTTLFLLEKTLGRRLVKVALTATLYDEKSSLDLLSISNRDNVVLIKDPTVRGMEIEIKVPGCDSQLCREINGFVESEELAAKITEIIEKIRENKYILVFTNTRSLAESLGALIREICEQQRLGIRIDVHHGSLSRQHRERIEKEFRERKLNAIVATSSLELGIDIGHVEYVIQYSSPRQAIRLTQRIGRSRHRLGDISRGEIVSTGNLIHVLESTVLAWNAMNGKLEREVIIPKPLDVLAYAIGLYTLLSAEGISISQLYSELRNHPLFRDLTESELNEVIDYLKYTRIVREESGHLYPTKKTRLYLYKVSMIPSTREVDVVEAGSGRRIGTLDEEYVVINLNQGDVIILAGRAWRIISYNETEHKLYVEPVVETRDVIIPHWEGENIPVEYSVAQEIGRALDHIKRYNEFPDHLGKLLENDLSINKEAISQIGDHRNIYVDYIKEFNLIIVNVYGGTKVNALIRDLLRYLLKARYPFLKLNVHSTPYYVILQLGDIRTIDQSMLPTEFVYDVMKRLSDYSSRDMIERIARESTQYLWRIYQVAQRFGAISPEATHVSRRLLEAFDETIIGKEALKEVLIKDYDVDSFTQLVDAINRGEVQVALRRYEKLQDHHLVLLGYIEIPLMRELPPLDTTSFLEKILSRHVTLLCLRCGYSIRERIRELTKMNIYACPRCGMATLSIIKGQAEQEKALVNKLRKGEKLSSEEERLRRELVERAVLLYRFRDTALITLSIPGVTVREAARIISQYLNGEDLLKLLYEYEKRFIKIKKYLDEKKDSHEPR